MFETRQFTTFPFTIHLFRLRCWPIWREVDIIFIYKYILGFSQSELILLQWNRFRHYHWRFANKIRPLFSKNILGAPPKIKYKKFHPVQGSSITAASNQIIKMKIVSIAYKFLHSLVILDQAKKKISLVLKGSVISVIDNLVCRGISCHCKLKLTDSIN